MTTQQQFGEQIHIESDCEQNASLLKKLKMWNLAPHIKKLDAGIFFFLAFGMDKIHAQTLCSGQRNYQDKLTV